MKLLATALILTCCFFTATAQTDSSIVLPRPKVGIFIPLFLDEVFESDGTYKYPTSIPKNVLGGLEFYSGVRLALDSLQDAGAGVEVFVIDTKDKTRSLQQSVDEEMEGAALMIGMVQNPGELKIMADAANKKHIPFISASFPNDGGITENPSLVIINSTLKSHNQAIYRYIQSGYYDNNIVIFRRPGTQEDKIKTTLEDLNDKTGGIKLKWKVVDLPVEATTSDVEKYLDSTRDNLVYCATLDAAFSNNLLRRLSGLSSYYKTTVIGMPTWDGLRLDRSEFKGLEVIYTTPFVTASGANPKLVTSLANRFRAKSRSRASDMVYRGYEITLRYVGNMLQHMDNVINLSDHQNIIFTDFDIQPIRVKAKEDEAPDYYENTKIYFVKKIDGVVKGVY